ncbi:unnamed protein product [Amoebophrya sp. A25]|nr:unnamed protein product [Amoebophrya sp. A25]|eukprot:GSA25T00013622001.1
MGTTSEHVIDAFAGRNPHWHDSEAYLHSGENDAESQHSVAVNDWSCVGGKPMKVFPDFLGMSMPGYRYGITGATRPLMIVKPCACPGGVLQPPMEYDYGVRDSDGLWHVKSDKKFMGFYSAHQAGAHFEEKSGSVGTKRRRIHLPEPLDGGMTQILTAKQVSPNHLVVSGSPLVPVDDPEFFEGVGKSARPTNSSRRRNSFTIGEWLIDVFRSGLSSVAKTYQGSDDLKNRFQREGETFFHIGKRQCFEVVRDRDDGHENEDSNRSTEVPDNKLGSSRCDKVLGSSTTAFFGASTGSEPYSADYGCVAGPQTRGEDAGKRMGQFWSTVIAETDCPCDDEFSMIANKVKRPTVDVVLNPATLQTVRQILRLDFPLEQIPEDYLEVHQFLDAKARKGALQVYFQPQGHTWVFHGFSEKGEKEAVGETVQKMHQFSDGFY